MSKADEFPPPTASPGPVTAADVTLAARLAVAALRPAPPEAWDRQAGPLEWDCWETGQHLLHCHVVYATQLTPADPPQDGMLPLVRSAARPGAPRPALQADRSAGPAGLLRVLDSAAGLLAAVVRVTPPEVRAFHPYGVSDAEGFAAMGVVETLAHTWDLTQGLGLAWDPPADLCARVLARLFPGAPGPAEAAAGPWAVLLWATGRGDLPGRDRAPADWRWDPTPRP
ncbi:hypothetical protein RKE29_13220 [Streptomyces sp. B1866]|uniref:hypothetical protein n=1 Tax=Streptomyces sp. B1866 TaxID=3075431 RepID=UPI0028924FF5|nr:hypothetical protein [Streptomyces sp. B1866]MDT3397600.1 hypothetical protein [Streptomyces sp. B1866]